MLCGVGQRTRETDVILAGASSTTASHPSSRISGHQRPMFVQAGVDLNRERPDNFTSLRLQYGGLESFELRRVLDDTKYERATGI